MTKLSFFLVVAVALTACGESSGAGSGAGGTGGMANARTAGGVCDELCGWPDECFAQLGAPLEGADCVQTCEAQAEIVGIECVRAISSTISCLAKDTYHLVYMIL